MAGFRIPNPLRADVGVSVACESALGTELALLRRQPRLESGPWLHLADEMDPGPSAYMPERSLLAAPDFSSRAGTIDAIKAECVRQGLTLKTQVAYVLATADHETGHTFKPVIEAYWLPDPEAYLEKHHPQYYPYYGRGFVQLTWKANYEFYGNLLNVDLVGKPELALEPKTATFILIHGFKHGRFTGQKLKKFINTMGTDFVGARQCINLLDRADHIAMLARGHLAQLQDEK